MKILTKIRATIAKALKKTAKAGAIATSILLLVSLATPLLSTKVFADSGPFLNVDFGVANGSNPHTYAASTSANVGDTVTFNALVQNTGSAPASNLTFQVRGFNKASDGSYVSNGNDVFVNVSSSTANTGGKGNFDTTVTIPNSAQLKIIDPSVKIYWGNNTNPANPIPYDGNTTTTFSLIDPSQNGLDLSQINNDGPLPNGNAGQYGCDAEIVFQAKVVSTVQPTPTLTPTPVQQNLTCNGVTASPSGTIPNGTVVTITANGSGAINPVNVIWNVTKNGQSTSTTHSNISENSGENVFDQLTLVGTADQNTTANYTVNAVMSNSQGQTPASACQVSFNVTGPSVQAAVSTPSVAITKTLGTAGVIHVGDNLAFNVVLTDNGNNRLTKVGFSDNFNQTSDQGRITFTGATATETNGSNTTASVSVPMNVNGNTITFTDLTTLPGFQTMNPNDHINITLSFTASSVGSDTDTATVNAIAENGANLSQNATATATISPVAVAPNTGAEGSVALIAGATLVAAILSKKYLLKLLVR